MLESILAVLHNATTLLFGVYISAAFLGVRMNRHNVFTLLIFSGAVGIIYIAAYLGLGTEGTEKSILLLSTCRWCCSFPTTISTNRRFPSFRCLLPIFAARSASGWAWWPMLPCPRCGSTTRTHHRHSHHLHYPYTVCLRCYRAAVAKAHSVPPHLGPNAPSLLCV